MQVVQRQEYGILLVSFRMISVLQNLIQRNVSFDFGLRVDDAYSVFSICVTPSSFNDGFNQYLIRKP